MKKFIPLLLITLFFSIQVINAQNAPVSSIGTIETYGSTTVVPVTVTGFTEIGSCDLLLNYDPAIASATLVTLGPGVGQFFFGANIGTPGIISVTWLFFQPGIPGLTLPDNSVFLNITFERVNYGYSAIEFDNSLPDNCLYADGNFDELNDTPAADYYFDGSVTFSSDGIVLSLKAFLEGPYGVSDMSADLNPWFIQYNQPYNTAPWNYSGGESFIAVPNANVVDWVLVELRQTAGSAATATSSTMVARQAALLLQNGSIVGTDGITNLVFDITVTSNLYVVIWHRNHLGMMSSVPLIIGGGIYSYDFTTALSKAYLNGQVSLDGGNYGMYAGNADGIQTVNAFDILLKWDLQVGESGYHSADMDMNSQVNNLDKNDVWLPNLGKGSKVP